VAAQVLLELGADAGLRDNKGRLAVHFAAERGQSAALRILVATPEDVMAMDRSGDTALHVAASRGHAQAVRVLHQLGARVNERNRKGFSALYSAARKGQVCSQPTNTHTPFHIPLQCLSVHRFLFLVSRHVKSLHGG